MENVTEEKLKELARKKRNEYARNWRKRNPEKAREYVERHWKKRALEQLKEDKANG